jgi:hypothetical protein
VFNASLTRFLEITQVECATPLVPSKRHHLRLKLSIYYTLRLANTYVLRVVPTRITTDRQPSLSNVHTCNDGSHLVMILVAAQHLHSPGLHWQLQQRRQRMCFGWIKSERGYERVATAAGARATGCMFVDGVLDKGERGNKDVRCDGYVNGTGGGGTYGRHCVGPIKLWRCSDDSMEVKRWLTMGTRHKKGGIIYMFF